MEKLAEVFAPDRDVNWHGTLPPYRRTKQNGMAEHVIRTLMEQCVHRQRFDSTQHEARVILDWISFYSDRRSHRALAEAFRLAA
jgi:hypothetical protein